MSDLIDRQTAQRLFRKAISFREYVGKMMWSASEVKEWVAEFIEDLPSAEPEIIHCKDCKYWTHINRTNRYWCKTDDGLFDLNPLPDDFCSRAKRRT